MYEDRESGESAAAVARGHVTILFTDLSDSTQLSGAMEAETYAAMLDEVRQAFVAAVRSRGGTVNQYQGDGLQALFGYPNPSENDGRQAVDAALEVHRRVRELRPRYAADGAGALSVHSGVHTGLALSRPGDGIAGRVELFGPAPGIAKHLSDEADADEILVSDETLGPAGPLFERSQARRVRLKGRQDPLLVRRVLSRSVLASRVEGPTRRGLASFLGREEELARLDEWLADVKAGRKRWAVVIAPAGMGKTRLAEEFLARAARRGCTVLRGYCDNELNAEPLQPVLQMLRAHFQLLPEMSPEAAAAAVEGSLRGLLPAHERVLPLLLRALSVASTPPGERPPSPVEGALQVLGDVISALALRATLVLFVDDWQWADDATRQLVHRLHDDPALALMLVAASRPATAGEVEHGAPDELVLSPFGETEALATIAAVHPAADPFVAAQIVRQGGGNPLFIEELSHYAASASAVELRPMQGGPAWLETLIASRIARLPAGQRRVIDAAAVIGSVVPAWLLERLTGCGADHPDVMALARHDLLFPAEEAGMLRFKHGITRDVVYGAIGLEARRSAHRQAAVLLAVADARPEALPCEALAYHCMGGGDPAGAARYAAMAGDKAMLASSIDRAKAQYRVALEQIDRLSESAEQYGWWRAIVRRLGMVSVFDPLRSDVQMFERAIALARRHADAPGLAFASYWQAYLCYALGEMKMAVRLVESALGAATAVGDHKLAAQVKALQGQTLAAAGRSSMAEAIIDDVLERAAAEARAATPSRPLPGLSYTLACRASVAGDRGRIDEAMRGFERALQMLPGPGHEVEGSVLCLRANLHLWLGRWDEAAADAAAAQRVGERVRSLYLFAMSQSLGAWAAWCRDRDAAALQSLSEATSWMIVREKALFISLNHARLAEAHASLGHAALARQHAAAALARVRDSDPLGAPIAWRVLARMAADRDQQALARRRLAAAEKMAALRDSAPERAANARCRAELGLG